MKAIILRGLPGAGKSTWVTANAPAATVCSADHFMVESDGVYRWSPKKLGAAHEACVKKYTDALQRRVELVVVDNTNLTGREIKPYVELAEKYGYEIEIRTIEVDPEVAMKRQLHGVPEEKYKLLAERLAMPLKPEYQKYLTPKETT